MHWVVSGGPLRVPIVNILGENLFKILFALITTLNLVWMGIAYLNALYGPTWRSVNRSTASHDNNYVRGLYYAAHEYYG